MEIKPNLIRVKILCLPFRQLAGFWDKKRKAKRLYSYFGWKQAVVEVKPLETKLNLST